VTALALSYALCSAAFIALAGVALTVWRGRTAGSWLPVAFIAQAVWAGMVAILTLPAPMPLSLAVALELLRSFSWLMVLLAALAPLFLRTAPKRLVGTLWGGIALVVLAVAAGPAVVTGGAAAEYLLAIQSWAGLLSSIAGLVLVEQFARNTRDDARWNLKYIWLGVGILFAIDLCLWSMALLLQQLGAPLLALRAFVNLLVAAMLVTALSRISRWHGTLFSTSGAFFFNTTLVMAGGYVLLMSLASWLLGQPAGEAVSAEPLASRGVVEVAFLAAALVLLAVAGFSDQFRAWFRVTFAKYLRTSQYDYRDVWLRLTQALSASGDVPLHDRVASVIGSYVNSGQVGLWLRESDGSYRRAGGVLELPGASTVPSGPFLDFLLANDWIYDLRDPGKRRAQRLTGPIPEAPEWARADPRAWLIVPLPCAGDLIGFAVVARPLTATPLGWEQLDILRAAGRQTASYLAVQQAAARLAESHQFEALNRLSGFVMHDLRHLVAQLALVVDNAARHRNNPEFIDDAILTIDSSVKRMNALMNVLRAGVVQEPERRVDLAEMARELRERCRHHQPLPDLELDPGPTEVMANRERLMQALEHLVRNAQDATPPTGTVTLRVRRGSHGAHVEIADTGCGMEPEFIRTRLFKPFDTTKGQKGMGLGAYEAREIVRKLGGSLAVESKVQHGSRILIELPLAPALAA
jgi:putative PEP-CTERM system histidine kinase